MSSPSPTRIQSCAPGSLQSCAGRSRASPARSCTPARSLSTCADVRSPSRSDPSRCRARSTCCWSSSPRSLRGCSPGPSSSSTCGGAAASAAPRSTVTPAGCAASCASAAQPLLVNVWGGRRAKGGTSHTDRRPALRSLSIRISPRFGRRRPAGRRPPTKHLPVLLGRPPQQFAGPPVEHHPVVTDKV